MLSQIGHKLPQMTFLMHIPTFFHLSLSSLQSSLSPCLLLRGSFFFSPPPPPSLSIFINSSFGVFCSRRPKTSPDCFQEDHSGCPRRSRKMLMTQNVILIRSGREKKNLLTPPPNTSAEQTSKPFFNPLRKKEKCKVASTAAAQSRCRSSERPLSSFGKISNCERPS